ncbi:MAG: sulfatase-like hydrolase/transferase [Proteobacteria bacterium]|nr:sulfatase-like hydrolase/transferase [Pseudomonadota bacterium]
MFRPLLGLLALTLILAACPTSPEPDDDDATAADDDDGTDDDDSGDDDDLADDDDVTPAGPPNILLLIIDDFGVGAASFDAASPCYDVGDISVDPALPTLAGLCADAHVFDTAWASPTCSPTRASILTGTLPHQHGVLSPADGDNRLDPENTWTLPRALDGADAGYAMANVGKWHLGGGNEDNPNLAGWHHFAGVLQGAIPSYFDWNRTVDGDTNPISEYATTVNVDDSIAWLNTLEADDPWLLWLAVNAPHDPWHVPPKELHDDVGLADYADEQRTTPWFVAMMTALDREFGRLLEEVEARGELDRTVIIVVGDNGTARGAADPVFNQGRSKGSLNEGGLHVPLLIVGPGVVPGRSEQLVSVADLFPTMLELAGVDVEAARAAQAPDVDLFGQSLVPLLEGKEPAGRDHLLVTSLSPGVGSLASGDAIRDATHKLICHDDGDVEFFHLAEDAFEDSDLFTTLGDLDAALVPTYEGLRNDAEALLGEPTACP